MNDATSDPAVDAWLIAEERWGSPEPRPVNHRLGPWTIERRGDELADIRLEGRPVLRSIRAVARDRDWNTVPTEVVAVVERPDRVDLDLRMTGYGADFTGRLSLAWVDGALTVALRLESRSDFERNRIGLVVLHPPGVAGAPLVVTSAGGQVGTRFPDRISPHQPAFDIVSLEWAAAGVASTLAFTGDTFEMEDQRNWTDASFKTYSTPLAIPFPVLVRTGGVIEQGLSLRADLVGGVAVEAGDSRTLDVARTDRLVPDLALGASTGLGSSSGERPPGQSILVELDVSSPRWRVALDSAALEAAGLPLDVRIVGVRDPDAIEPVVDALGSRNVVRVGAFGEAGAFASAELVARLSTSLERRGIRASIVGGTRGHFTELNRSPGVVARIDGVAFSITPQTHARERSQLVESIAMQREVAENAVALAGGLPVHVGPITLRARFKAVAPSPLSSSTPAEGYGAALRPDATDPRQSSDALAAWTVASAAALSVPGVASLAYFEVDGPRGIRGFPVEEAISALHDIAGRPLLTAQTPSDVWLLGGITDAGAVVLVANLRSTATRVTIAAEAIGGGEVDLLLEPLSFRRVAF